MFFSISTIPLRIAASVVQSAFFGDSLKLCCKALNCCRVRASNSWRSRSVLVFIFSAREFKFPVFIYTSETIRFAKPLIHPFSSDFLILTNEPGQEATANAYFAVRRHSWLF